MADFTMYDREREFKWQIECQLSGGTNAYIDAEDIYSGRLTRQISSGEGIEVGSCYVSELDLTIVASALPVNVVSVKPYFRLLTSTDIVDNVMKKYYTPYNLGVFKIASTKRKEYGRIDLVCYDKMADLDTLITPAAYTELLASDWKPFYLLDWIATKVNVTYTFTQSGIEAMPNGTLYFKLAEETSNIKTYRDLLQYVCMLIGAYGIFDEDGHLNIKTFADATSYSLPASFRFSESFGDVPISYSGVELTVKNATTMFGNANNTVVRLSDNPFLYTLSNLNQTTDYATFIMQFLRNIYTEFQGLSYYAGEFEIPPDASLNVGRLLAVSGGGASTTINCFLQKIDVNFDGRMSLSCGNPNTYVARTQNRTTSSITNLTNRIETLESSQGGGGNKIYTSTADPDETAGNEGDMWVKYAEKSTDNIALLSPNGFNDTYVKSGVGLSNIVSDIPTEETIETTANSDILTPFHGSNYILNYGQKNGIPAIMNGGVIGGTVLDEESTYRWISMGYSIPITVLYGYDILTVSVALLERNTDATGLKYCNVSLQKLDKTTDKIKSVVTVHIYEDDFSNTSGRTYSVNISNLEFDYIEISFANSRFRINSIAVGKSSKNYEIKTVHAKCENTWLLATDKEGEKYLAGDNITISSDNIISAKDTTYNAGQGISIDKNNTISANNINEVALYESPQKNIRFGIDADGNYGYYKDGADTVTPFKTGDAPTPSGNVNLGTFTSNGVKNGHRVSGYETASMTINVEPHNVSSENSRYFEGLTPGCYYAVSSAGSGTWMYNMHVVSGGQEIATCVFDLSYAGYYFTTVFFKATGSKVVITDGEYSMSDGSIIKFEL